MTHTEKTAEILNGIRDGLFTTDQKGVITFVNMPLAAMHGLEGPEEMIGRHFSEFVSPEFRPEMMSKFKRAVEEESYSEIVEFCTVRKDGTTLFIQLKHGPIIRNGQIVGTAGVIRDINERKRAEQALAASEKKYRAIVENMSDVVFIVDQTGKLLFITPSATRLIGYAQSEMIGHHIQDFFYEEDLKPALNNIRRAISEKGIISTEFRLMHKNGGMLWIQTFTRPLFEGDNVVALQGSFWDITERKRVEEALRKSEEKYRSLVETTSEWIWETDADGVYTYASPRVRDLLGYEPEEVIGRKPFAFMPPDESARVMAEFSAIAKGRKTFFGIENVNLGKDGRRVVLETSGVPVLDGQGNLLGYRGIDRDITDRKRAEEALQRSHLELEYRVTQRTAELERRNRELQEFAFVAAHDLSEPLRKIQVLGSYLSAKKADRLDEEGKDYISRMRDAANRMRGLLDALLRYTRIETKGGKFRPTRLNDVAREAAGDLEVEIRNMGAHVEVGPLPSVTGDPSQLRQLFLDLIANALKYCRSEVKPSIKIYGEEKNGVCRFFVEDNGIGFDEKYLHKIFQPFQRLHGKHEYPGVGIGLAICKKIVERHGGTITAESTPGKGSRFIVTLPVNQGKSKP